MKTPLNPCITDMERIATRRSTNCSAAELWSTGRRAVRRFRTVTIKISAMWVETPFRSDVWMELPHTQIYVTQSQTNPFIKLPGRSGKRIERNNTGPITPRKVIEQEWRYEIHSLVSW